MESSIKILVGTLIIGAVLLLGALFVVASAILFLAGMQVTLANLVLLMIASAFGFIIGITAMELFVSKLWLK